MEKKKLNKNNRAYANWITAQMKACIEAIANQEKITQNQLIVNAISEYIAKRLKCEK